MQYSGSSSILRILRVATVLLGLTIVILGFVSHFDSFWAKKRCTGDLCIAQYQMCDAPGIKKCPNISMERYFVAIIFICFALSVVSLAASFLLKENIRSNRIYKLTDTGYHAISLVLLFIAAVVYFVSAEQINKLMGFNKRLNINYRRPEKLAAASLTLIQAGLYGVTAFFIYTS